MPALPPYIIEPIWQRFLALSPSRGVDHPLGRHRPRVPDHVVFEKLVRVSVFGRAYPVGSPTPRARQLRCAVGATSGSRPERWRLWGSRRRSPTIVSSVSNRPMWPSIAASRRLLAEAKGRGKARWIGANGPLSARRWWTPTGHPPGSRFGSGQPSRLPALGSHPGLPEGVGAAARVGERTHTSTAATIRTSPADS